MEFRSQPLSRSLQFGWRLRVSVIVLLLGLGALGLRVGYLTTIQGPRYQTAARQNIENVRRLAAPRGNIYDREGRPLAFNRRAYSVTYSRYRRSTDQVHQTLRLLGNLLDEDVLARKDEILETRPTWTRHTIARRVSQPQVVPILERPEDFRGVRLRDDYRREYPFGAALAPITGYVSIMQREDLGVYRPPLYLADDVVGRTGLERFYEERLVGKPGRLRLRTDARGTLLEAPAYEETARPGDDLLLSVDAELQTEAMGLLAGMTGSLVVVDVWTGDVLVMATRPTYDPLRPGLQEIDGEATSQFNRAYRGGYAPGSTFKLVTASAALRAGWNPNEHVTCTGSYQWPGWLKRFHCNVREGHGPMDLGDSIKVSCNSYFYRLGEEFGAEPLVEEARRYGFGTPTGLDLGGELQGAITPGDRLPEYGEILNLTIGQGELLSSPLHLAMVYAALANGGDMLEPRLVREIRPGGGGAPEIVPVQRRWNLELPEGTLEFFAASLDAAVNQRRGTAFKAEFPAEWQVCGKTGTAENGRGGVDAWFTGYFPRHAPRFAVVSQVEEADGHGGEVAAPIARQLIEHMVTRGYLNDSPAQTFVAMQ